MGRIPHSKGDGDEAVEVHGRIEKRDIERIAAIANDVRCPVGVKSSRLLQ
jgi:hypothetical protein